MTAAGIHNVWIIDDNPTDRFVHRKLLEIYKIGQHIEEFSSGKSAVQALKELSGTKEKIPDIILLDIMMPEMSGFDFMIHFHTQKRKLPKIPLVFMLSSTDDDNDLRRVKEDPNIHKLLRKPFSPESFLKALLKL